MKYLISGYWSDDKTEFQDYIVKDTDEIADDDDNIFYYGLSESTIKQAIASGEPISDFVITKYKEVRL